MHAGDEWSSGTRMCACPATAHERAHQSLACVHVQPPLTNVLINPSQVESGAMVAAGAVVGAGTTVPSGQIWGGSPARYLRDLKPEEAAFLKESADSYVAVAAEHIKENAATLEQVARAKGQA